jgi:hypothetical protein
MLFVGNQRGGAKNLAAHLLSPDNEHVEVHEVRGFASDTVSGAFNEAYALSRGTRCTQFLFSLSVNPPPKEQPSTQDFEDAIDRAEERLGLGGQPRAIIFHEKNGRRHAHAVWSRIDTDEMKAVQLSFTHKKLMDVSKELFLQHGWKMPRGSLRDPRNFTLDEWQQARRQGNDPRAIKTALQDTWAISDSKAAFMHALRDSGFTLARGDRRGFVVLDRNAEIYAIGKKWLSMPVKSIRERLGDPKDLPDVETAKARIAQEMQPTLDRLNRELSQRREKLNAIYEKRKANLVERQRVERKAFFDTLESRRIAESKDRQQRFRKGVKGLWDRLRGEHKRIQQRNEKEAIEAYLRDRTAKDKLILSQLEQRQKLDAVLCMRGSRNGLVIRAETLSAMASSIPVCENLPQNRTLRLNGNPARGSFLLAKGRHVSIEF